MTEDKQYNTADPLGDREQTSMEATAKIEPEVLNVDEFVKAKLTEKPQEKYRFRRSIGRGGMKMVLQVFDNDTMRDVAMALMPDFAARSKNEILRFIQEARVTASLEHPNIVPVHDIGMDSSGSPYFTMKLLSGETLASLLKRLETGEEEYRRKYSFDTLMRIYMRICNGVAFAHSKGIIHLDLKPENIQIGEFGEVLILDWGLARSIRPKLFPEDLPGGAEEGGDGKGFSDFNLTMNGRLNGTPGYMAPEQALGKTEEQDIRTDVYALGAILYAMVTYQEPIAGGDLKTMMNDTIAGNIIKPRDRVPDLDVSYGIEAVILKAMSVNPEDRYQSVMELRDDVVAYVDGFDTKAEKAGILKKMLLFAKRNRLILSSIAISCALILGFALYAVLEVSRWKSDWIPVYQQDFTRKDAVLTGLSFMDPTLKKVVAPWKLSPEGLVTPKGEWVWLDEKLHGNVRVVITVQTPPVLESLEISVNSRLDSLKEWWQVPRGYSFLVAGFNGTTDAVIKVHDPLSPEYISSGETKLQPNEIQTIVVERKDDMLSLTVNEAETISLYDYFPPMGTGLCRIGIRARAGGLKIRSIAAYRLAIPEKTTPLIAGDTLLEAQLPDAAIQKYLMISDSYAKTPLSEMALVKAYMTAASHISDHEARTSMLVEIKKRIASQFTTFKYRDRILELDACLLWMDGDYPQATALMKEVFLLNPNTNVILKILQLPHKELPRETLSSLMQMIGKSRNLNRLDLSGYGLRSLEGLRGLPLVYLDCSDNRLTNLKGLEKMPLEVLIGNRNKIEEIAILRDMPLKSLSLANNRISDLHPLRGMFLTSLDLSNNALEKMDALRFVEVEKLKIRGNRISSLRPLSLQSKLNALDAGENPISDLDPLSELNLEILNLDFTDISDLKPLRGLPLFYLNVGNCRNLKDLAPLEECRKLEFLSIPKTPAPIDFLRNLPNLQVLEYDSSSESPSKPMPAVDFWKWYDMQGKNQ